MKELVFTWDYEVYFGENYRDVNEVLIEPTEEILNLSSKYKIKYIFFVDVFFLEYLKNSNENMYTKIIAQLKRISSEGHLLQPHFHPHWINYTGDLSKLDFDKRYYTFRHISEVDAELWIRRSLDLLSRLASNKLSIYRGGGYFSDVWERYGFILKSYGVECDNSIIPGYFERGSHGAIDYRNISIKAKSWSFDSNPALMTMDGNYKAIPISNRKKSMRVLFWLAKEKAGSRIPLGRSISKNYWDRIQSLLLAQRLPLTIDGKIRARIARKIIFNSTNEQFIVVGHPKTLTKEVLVEIERLMKADNISITTLIK